MTKPSTDSQQRQEQVEALEPELRKLRPSELEVVEGGDSDPVTQTYPSVEY